MGWVVNARPPQLYPCIGGPRGWLEYVQKILSPPEFDPRTIQAAASRYADDATRPIPTTLPDPENRVLRRIFGPKRDELTGEW